MEYRDLLQIMGELDDLLLPYSIDLSILHMIDHSGLLDHIHRVGLVFYKKPHVGETSPLVFSAKSPDDESL